MMRWPLWVVAIAAFAAVACGTTTPSTTTTTTVAPTLSISPQTAALAVGQVQAYTVINGVATDTTTWSSSNAGIFTVDSAGNVTGVSSGVATLTATASSGPTATLQIQIVPNYQGTWSGNSTVTACTDIGGFETNAYCAQRVRTTQRMTIAINQAGLAITGTLTQAETTGQVVGSVTGAIGAGGDISTLAGTLTGVVNGANITTTIISWDALATTSGLTGNWAGNITSSQIVGIATVQWQFTAIPRVASAEAPIRGVWSLVAFLRHP
jgi:hypothetical protein